jgi:broad specificity phosphatase PhoE
MQIILVRHFESIKNRRMIFSSIKDVEALTSMGAQRAAQVGEVLREFYHIDRHRVNVIYTSSSARGIQSGEILADTIGIDKVKPCEFLRSTKAGPYSGLSLGTIKKLNPEWVESMRLYRAGLFNLYRFDREWHAEGKEDKRDFESRVLTGFHSILSEDNSPTKLILANRSAISAILLHFARLAYDYPDDFYGYVRIDLGSVSILDMADSGEWRIKMVNHNVLRLKRRR